MTKSRSRRAVTVRCVVCGLEVTGVQDEIGVVRPSDASRPEPGEPIRDGFCIRHADEAIDDASGMSGVEWASDSPEKP